MFKLDSPEALIEKIVSLSNIARKEGMLALENEEIENEFLNQGIQMLIDGNNQEVIQAVMSKDLQQTIDRHKWGAKVYSAMGDVAPAMGMIGTLIGLVQMLSSMGRPQIDRARYGGRAADHTLRRHAGQHGRQSHADKLTLRKADEGASRPCVSMAYSPSRPGKTRESSNPC